MNSCANVLNNHFVSPPNIACKNTSSIVNYLIKLTTHGLKHYQYEDGKRDSRPSTTVKPIKQTGKHCCLPVHLYLLQANYSLINRLITFWSPEVSSTMYTPDAMLLNGMLIVPFCFIPRSLLYTLTPERSRTLTLTGVTLL